MSNLNAEQLNQLSHFELFSLGIYEKGDEEGVCITTKQTPLGGTSTRTFYTKCVECKSPKTTDKDMEYHWCFGCFKKYDRGEIKGWNRHKPEPVEYDFLPSTDDESN
tara:strand:- start:940 stop:1260 length:321 start_codon:yes stop_codon:yes gene_type:complete